MAPANPIDADPGAATSAAGVAARVAKRYLAPRWRALAVSLVCAVAFAGLSGLRHVEDL